MAKDGTNRGGRRVRAGDKPAPAAEKKIEPTLFQTNLAQWVSRCIPLSYLTPCSAVLFVAVGRADEFIIAAVHLL